MHIAMMIRQKNLSGRFPFINLQMASLGLNTEDISLVNGLIPLAIMITTPIAGRQLS